MSPPRGSVSRAKGFDLVLLDLNLPRERGEQLCRRLRRRRAVQLPNRWLSIPGWASASDLLAGLEAGADFVVAKELVRLFDDWVSRVGEILSTYVVERVRGYVQIEEEPIPSPSSGEGIGVIAKALTPFLPS